MFNLIPSVTSDVWKNNFLPPSTSYVKNPKSPIKKKKSYPHQKHIMYNKITNSLNFNKPLIAST